MLETFAPPRVSYGDWSTGVRGYRQRLLSLLDHERPRTVCDVGGGARPSLTSEEVVERGVGYTLLDISQVELDKSSDTYNKLCLDICAPLPTDHSRYDFVLSHMLAEHVANPVAFHRNIYELLNPNGVAVHMMPTLYDPAFVANRLLPDRFTRALVRRAQPQRDLGHLAGKFPAYYRWCRGPSRRHIRRFESIGFRVEQMTGYFGTNYFARVELLQMVHDRAWVAPLVRHPVPLLTSYSWIVLRRPPTG